MPQIIEIHLHHEGKITFDPSGVYENRTCTVIKGWDVDEISSLEVTKLVKALGYANINRLWYRHPGSDGSSGIRPLNSDRDVVQILADVKGHKIVDMLVE